MDILAHSIKTGHRDNGPDNAPQDITLNIKQANKTQGMNERRTCGIKNTSETTRKRGIEIKKNFLLQIFCLSAAKHSFTLPTGPTLWGGDLSRGFFPFILAEGEFAIQTSFHPLNILPPETWMDTNPLLYFQLSIVVAPLPLPASHCVGVGIIIKVQSLPQMNPFQPHIAFLALSLPHTHTRTCLDFPSFYSLVLFGPQIVKWKFRQKSHLMPLFHLTDSGWLFSFFPIFFLCWPSHLVFPFF